MYSVIVVPPDGKKEFLISLALRFDLVGEDDLDLLTPVPCEAAA